MTSSLVGSEMCIRDRWKGANLLETAGNCKRAQGIARHFRKLQDTAGDSVSYTHLTLPTICSV
eukprot:5231160-Prorocentrum_lima.AAC.1